MAIKDYTRLGTDARKIARLLQAKAPPGHTLAYITPEEARVLKDRGGSGKPQPDTGIPSYEVEGDPGFSYDIAGETAPGYAQSQAYSYDVGGETGPSYGTDYFAGVLPSYQPVQAPQPISPETGMPFSIETPTFRPEVAATGLREPTEADRAAPAAGAGAGQGILKQLGMGLAQAIPGALLARRAGKQAGGTQAQMQEVAAPYRQLGQQLQAQAGRGELAPAAQQSLQAAQAQLAQQAQARGGVGAAQIQTQLESFRQQLLQQQMDYGLKLSGIGDQIALGAIRAGAQADQYVNQLTSQFMNNLFRGMQPTPQATPPGG